MNRLVLVAALAAATALPAAAHHGPRHHHGGKRYYAPHYSYPYSFYYGPRYYAPVHAAPLYSWAPPAVVAPPYSMAPPPPAQPYRERSYAEVRPPEPPRAERLPKPQPAPPPAPPPAIAMERITLSAKELFEFDHANINNPQPKLDEIAHVMRRHEEIASVRIIGYTDHIGTESYNQALSERRANAVKDYLVARGVETHRLQALGLGEANPVVVCNDTTEQADLIKCLEPNRRVEVEPITVSVPRNPASG